MLEWKKHGLIFDAVGFEGRDWLKAFAQAPSVLIFDDHIRVYFSCRPDPDGNGQYCSYSAFVDLKREDLKEILRVSENPILPLGGIGAFDEFGVYPVSAIRDGNEVRVYYAGWTRCESVPFNTAIGAAVSRDDGITFQKIGSGGPVLGYSPHEPFVLSGPKIRKFDNKWCLWYIAGRKWVMDDGKAEPVYKIRMATSGDGIRWERMNRDLIDNRLEEDEAQASPDVIFANGRYHMFFCYRYSLGYRGREKGYRIGYASSTDMIHWTRDDANVGIDVSEGGWDSEMISYPHVFELDGEIYMFYLGNQVGRAGFGMAQLKGKL